MSFFTRVFGIFGKEKDADGNPIDTTKDVKESTVGQEENHRSNELESSGASIDSDPQKPTPNSAQQAPRPITGTAGIKKDGSRKPKKKKPKGDQNGSLPGIQNPSHISVKDVERKDDSSPDKPMARSPTNLGDPSKRVGGISGVRKASYTKRASDHGKDHGKDLVPANVPNSAPAHSTQPMAKTPDKKKGNKAKNKKKNNGSNHSHRLRLSDDVFPLTGGSHNISKGFKSRVKTPIGRSVKTTKSAPSVLNAEGRNYEPEVGLVDTPSYRERLRKAQLAAGATFPKTKPKATTKSKFSGTKKKDGKAGDKDSIENDASAEQLAECAPSTEQQISIEKKIAVAEEVPVDKSPPEPIVLDREEVTRLITEIKQEDRNPPPMEHDPWAPMSVLMARNDFYSDHRARINAALTYEKFAEYELSSNKDNPVTPRSKPDISIFPSIDRTQFDVNNHAVLTHDVTPVIDHEPGTNHPDGN
uniref:ULP_PROTEASE domain-containing protein n=1 Tax=Panagrellus redivivus TaxID=6233 RepID=A0A7E4VP45_PANRE